jgi:uncharacterized protein with HEPN domain
VKDDSIYLLHIRDCLDRISDYTAAGEESFLQDKKTQDAVVRNLEVIGEAAKHVSEKLRARHSDVQWKRIVGMREKMIQEYFGVNLQLVWNVIVQELPDLRRRIQQILASGGEAALGTSERALP